MTIPAADFNTIKKIFLGIGCIALLVSCVMTWKFGNSFSFIHGVGLVTVTLAAAFLFPAKRMITEMGVGRFGQGALAVVGCFLIALELFADLGYTIGMRDKQIVESGAQTVAYNTVQENMISEKANLDMWRKQLADLKSQNAWAATVTATGLRAQLESAQKAIDLEAARKGCKTKCLELMKQKGSLEERIATLERTDDLAKRIEATQRILDRKVEAAPATKIGHSTVKAQVDFVSKGYLLAFGDGDAKSALNPDAVTMTVADWVIGFAIALGATFLPTTAFYIAFFGAAPAQAARPAARTTPATASVPTIQPIAQPTRSTHETIIMKDVDDRWERVKAALHGSPVAA
jgi:hypothetical protein